MKRHLLSMSDLSAGEIGKILALTSRLKRNAAAFSRKLTGRRVALVFEKPSTRTRLATEVACLKLGASPLVISGTELQIGRGETIEDSARVFSRFVDAICWRTSAHGRLEAFARSGSIPVINTLSDLEHPTQVLADLFTLREHFKARKWPSVAFIGDGGGNVAHSWLLAAARLGMDFRLAYPKRYAPERGIVRDATREAKRTGAKITLTQDPERAAVGADVLYTDVWVSMGQEAEKRERLRRFSRYQLNSRILAKASRKVKVMHCLPAHRGEEIAAGLMDGPRSIVFDQAENRLHSTAAILLWCLKGGKT